MLLLTISIYSYPLLRYKDFKGQNGKSLSSYTSKSTNILKSIIEQKFLRIMSLTRCHFHFFWRFRSDHIIFKVLDYVIVDF